MFAGHEAAIHMEMHVHCVEVATRTKRVVNLRNLRLLSPEGGGGEGTVPHAYPPPLDPHLVCVCVCVCVYVCGWVTPTPEEPSCI